MRPKHLQLRNNSYICRGNEDKHPLYKKTVRVTNKYKVHDEENAARIGDTVEITETRPLSKDKRWRLVEILARAK